MQEDISRKTVVMLLVLVVVLSVLGTWSVFTEIDKFDDIKSQDNGNQAYGEVKLTILKPDMEPPKNIASGKVQIEILEE